GRLGALPGRPGRGGDGGEAWLVRRPQGPLAPAGTDCRPPPAARRRDMAGTAIALHAGDGGVEAGPDELRLYGPAGGGGDERTVRRRAADRQRRRDRREGTVRQARRLDGLQRADRRREARGRDVLRPPQQPWFAGQLARPWRRLDVAGVQPA